MVNKREQGPLVDNDYGEILEYLSQALYVSSTMDSGSLNASQPCLRVLEVSLASLSFSETARVKSVDHYFGTFLSKNVTSSDCLAMLSFTIA